MISDDGFCKVCGLGMILQAIWLTIVRHNEIFEIFLYTHLSSIGIVLNIKVEVFFFGKANAYMAAQKSIRNQNEWMVFH